MRHETWQRAAAHVALAGMMLLMLVTVVGVPPAAAATQVVASYQMNEPSGSTTLIDSGPLGINGSIGTTVVTGGVYDGATGFSFPYKKPNSLPVDQQRLAIVGNDANLNPGADDFAIEFRYRTTQSFGNIVQKGQNATPGGYFKFEQPSGYMTCLFKGSAAEQRAVKSPFATNDGQWHVIRCERTSSYVRLLIDGVEVRRLNGSTGTISNTRPLSIGGKENCDQVTITCDYFTGQLDYVRFEKGTVTPPQNRPPTASMDVQCAGLACAFDSQGSTDSDGSIVARSWAFGDGGSAAAAAPAHTFATSGSYQVRLTVTDDDGATGQVTRTITVTSSATEIAYVGGSSTVVQSNRVTATIPAVAEGDVMMLFVSVASAVSVGEPTGVSGWNQADSAAAANGSSSTTLWWRTAGPQDAGRTVTVTFSASSKATATVAAYSGTASAAPVVVADGVVQNSGSARTTPIVQVGDAGSIAVSYWVHRDSSTTELAAPSGVTVRTSSSQTGGGRLTTMLADSNGTVPAGDYGGLTAVAQASSSFGTAWTVVLRSR